MILPLVIVGGAVVLLLVVALGGYFFVYPRLRGGDAQPATTTQVSDTPARDAGASSGTSQESSSVASPENQQQPETETEAASREPILETESEAEPPGQTTPSDSGRSSQWSPPARTEARKPPVRSAPEPASTPVENAGQGQITRPSEPVVSEPVREVDERAPSVSHEETETVQAPAVETQPPLRQTPAYNGPTKGVVIWTGDADKGTTVVIEGTSASMGQVQGALPGVACMVRLNVPNVAVTEGPGPRNNYRRISLRFNKKGRFSVPVEWEVLH